MYLEIFFPESGETLEVQRRDMWTFEKVFTSLLKSLCLYVASDSKCNHDFDACQTSVW